MFLKKIKNANGIYGYDVTALEKSRIFKGFDEKKYVYCRCSEF